MKYLLITKCPDKRLWYRDLVGQHIPLVREDHEYFWGRETLPPYCLNLIKKTDAEVSDVTEVTHNT